MAAPSAATAFALLVAASSGLAADAPRFTWQRVGEGNFRSTIDRLAGDGAVDCGFVDLFAREPSRTERRHVLGCMDAARRDGKAFKYGTVRLPIDSIATEIYVQPPTGKPWMVIHDEMLGDEFVQVWVVSCKAVEVDRRTLIMTGVECIENEQEAERAR